MQTPTLALVVRRDRDIESFKPVPFYAVMAEFEAGAWRYRAAWQVPEALADPEGRCLAREAADQVAAKVAGQPGEVIEAKTQRKSQARGKNVNNIFTLFGGCGCQLFFLS